MNIIGKQDIDLAVLDITLPDGSGFEMCEYIKKYTNTPIIFLTARDEEQDVVKGLDMGAEDYIIKPFRNRELLSRINNVLRRFNTESNKITKFPATSHIFSRICSRVMVLPMFINSKAKILYSNAVRPMSLPSTKTVFSSRFI